MNSFLRKEVRLLLPSWIVVLVLAMVSPWLFWNTRDTGIGCTPLFLFFGMILFSVDCFGREFNLGTFTSLMSQPIERRQIWQTKITLLCGATAVIYLVYFISCESLLDLSQKVASPNISNVMLAKDFWPAMLNGCVALLLALAGGLWTSLLLRQISASFWITFLVPLGLLVLLTFFLPATFQASAFFLPFIYCLAGIYCVAGVWLAHRLFQGSQDVAWTGGVIAFSRWRYFEANSKNIVAVRRPKPLRALFNKEFQLQSISLFCVGALLVLHLAVFLMRAFYGGHFEPNSVAGTISEFFWIFWLILPLVIGCMAVAEERKLGVMESQFCLPVSRRTQFLVKFIPAVIAGVLLGGFMPMMLELIAARLHLPNSIVNADSFLASIWLPDTDLALIFCLFGLTGLVLAGFLASTLAKNFMQALSIAIVILATCCLTYGSLHDLVFRVGWKWWGLLPAPIGLLTNIIFVPWLCYRNFCHFSESSLLWRRNVFGLIIALIIIFVGSAFIYHRAWEIFQPAEPPHGAAKFSVSNPPVIEIGYSDVQARLPDGRLWFDCLGDPNSVGQSETWSELGHRYYHRLPQSIGPAQFVAGSNWVSSAPTFRVDEGQTKLAGYLDTVCIRTDGSLWISSEVKRSGWTGDSMIQFGDETNWQQVVNSGINFVLLKRDGTIWQWGTNRDDWRGMRTNWPTVRYSAPRQIGEDSDWKKLFGVTFYSSFAQKSDGAIWHLHWNDNSNAVELTTQTEQLGKITPMFFSWLNEDRLAYISTSGSLWIGNRQRKQIGDQWFWTGSGFNQVGIETNWAGVAFSFNQLVALKKDGTLWQWEIREDELSDSAILPLSEPFDLTKIPPKRVGIHDDWVAVSSFRSGTVALAADGSLWFWPSPEEYDGAMFKASKQPEFLANILSSNN